MGKSVRNPLRLIETLQRKLKAIYSNGLVFTGHCLVRMTKRNASLGDILHSLKSGVILRNPEWDVEHENWKYRVEGFDQDGFDLTVIIATDEAMKTLYLITVF